MKFVGDDANMSAQAAELRLPKVLVTSVVRGSQQGESHGGVYSVDFENQSLEQYVDWNTTTIDFDGRGADRGLRGIAFDGDDILIAASDELFVFDRDFSMQGSWRNRYLKHCHEICRMDQMVFLTSTGFDSLLAFDLEKKIFNWGFQLEKKQEAWSGFVFDPRSGLGPRPVNNHHINMVHVDSTGIYLSGLKTRALLHINRDMGVEVVCDLPGGTHNARPYGDGVIFNDTASDCVRYVSRKGEQQTYRIKRYDSADIVNAGIDDSNIARQAFGRGLCTYRDRFLVGGSSPSTISIYDLVSGQTVGSVNLTMDIRNAIHGLELWPFVG